MATTSHNLIELDVDSVNTVDWSGNPAVEGRPEYGYGEDAFRYFLGLERKRAAHARRSLLLVLVQLSTGDAAPLSPEASESLFAALGLCIREVDFLGWYRQDRILGAVLTQAAGSLTPSLCSFIRERVDDGLKGALSASLGLRVNVRVLELRQQAGRSSGV